ncbi:hypothetical protein DENIS_3246 [Desulfonema ishimotonii]|uniref:Uncharacterized protein n=1 Tax=Desulfonema ishimotonii TaxID=45657 RepID=A0A401FZ99_9BACT|nr:hypothetical protein DENIS_3246 [Desulfonema ishimotonii]
MIYTVNDPEVSHAYASKLIPRAVGYSAGLLDYFFRGKLDITIDNDATLIDPFRKCIDHLELTVTNSTPDEDMTEGRLVLVVKYRMAEDEPYQYITGDISESFSLGTGMTSDTISFDFPFDPYNPENTKQGIPLDAQEASIYVVYRGQLGNEEDGIAVGMLRDLNSGSEDEEASNVRDFIPETAQGLDITLPEKNVWSYTESDPASSDPATEGFGHFAFHLTNNTPEDISMENGEITAVIRYRVSESNPFTDYGVEGPPATSSEYYKIIRTASGVDGVAGGAWFPFEADLTSENIPLWATDLFLYVLYRSGGVFFIITKNIYEPTPVYIFNSTDKVCLYDTLYETDSQAAQDIMEEYDEWDKEPETYDDFFLRFSPGDALSASDSCAPRNSCSDCVYPEQENIPPGGYHRIFILGDEYYSYGVNLRSGGRKTYKTSKRYTNENQFCGTGPQDRIILRFDEYETASGVIVIHGYQLLGNTCFGCGISDENPCYEDSGTGCYYDLTEYFSTETF